MGVSLSVGARSCRHSFMGSGQKVAGGGRAAPNGALHRRRPAGRGPRAGPGDIRPARCRPQPGGRRPGSGRKRRRRLAADSRPDQLRAAKASGHLGGQELDELSAALLEDANGLADRTVGAGARDAWVGISAWEGRHEARADRSAVEDWKRLTQRPQEVPDRHPVTRQFVQHVVNRDHRQSHEALLPAHHGWRREAQRGCPAGECAPPGVVRDRPPGVVSGLELALLQVLDVLGPREWLSKRILGEEPGKCAAEIPCSTGVPLADLRLPWVAVTVPVDDVALEGPAEFYRRVGRAVSSGARTDGDLSGTLAVSAQAGRKLLLLRPGTADDAERIVSVSVPAELDGDFGRLRGSRLGPDGALYVTTDNGEDDVLLRVERA